jgi:hypothetical protein
MDRKIKCLVLILVLMVEGIIIQAQSAIPRAEEKPWLWWYWLGSAVTREGLQQHIDAFQKEGIGGVNIAATYGVDGYEKESIPFMSPEWIQMVNYTGDISAAKGMAVDLSLGSAWPYGGSNVNKSMAARKLAGGKILTANGGEKLRLRLAGPDTSIAAVVAFSDKGQFIDLSSKITGDGFLSYKFPRGIWEIYGIFSVPTGQMVKRSGPGGAGLVLDHFSREAVEKYLGRFDSLFLNGRHIRSVFNDSYEVYGADFTPSFLDEFQKRRGYDLRRYLNIFSSNINSPDRWRILCDYRETISDLLLYNFVEPWNAWAHKHGIRTVEQAHGSPANWLDLYAASDIPQTESFGSSDFHIPMLRTDKDYAPEVFWRPDKLVMKFASSAANVSGKRLVSSETATWLGNHFKVALSQVKPQIDEVFISGINHVMLTCATYSPMNLGFPGWLFYPASNFGHNSGLVDYMPDFSGYIERSQQILQNSSPDNEILLYFPIYDIWSEMPEEDRSKLAMMAVHNPMEWFYKNDFGNVARKLRDEGFDFDYVSDRQLQGLSVKDNRLVTASGKSYKAIILPSCKRMPISTLQALHQLAARGIPIVFAYKSPYDVPGLLDAAQRRTRLVGMVKEMRSWKNVSVTGDFIGRLSEIGLRRESFPQFQLEYIRKSIDSGKVYFIANQQDQFREGWIPIPGQFNSVRQYDPMENRWGLLKKRGNEIYLQLSPGQSCFLKVYGASVQDKAWPYFYADKSQSLKGPWKITFEKGAPSIPAGYQQNDPGTWTQAPDTMAKYFSGTARYETNFDLPQGMLHDKNFRLNLGDVREMAEVSLNGRLIGRSWSVPYSLDIPPGILKSKGNHLTIKVTNLDANRVIWLDKKKVKWQKYFFVDITYGPFDASNWTPLASGLVGKVRLESGD